MHRRPGILLLIAAAVLTAAVAGTWLLRERPAPPSPPPAPLSTPTRAEALALAERYVTHAWTAEARHAFHGSDPSGIRIDTPDASFANGKKGMAGWWRTDETNLGLPYKWGGFDTPESFDAGLRSGKYAGDAYTAEKRRLLDDAVSESAVGIDCSGFVSRCWQLPRSYSTRELPALCDPVPDPDDWRPGDILNTHNRHVRLFAGWEDRAAGRALFYEASERVRREVHDIHGMLAEGYQAWRYRGMRED